MRFIPLSYMLEENSPVHLNLKKPELTHNKQIPNNGYNTYLINVENHSGTHIDASNHFIENGKLISDYSHNELTFTKPLILDVPKNPNELIEIDDVSDVNLNNVDCLFFRTEFGKFRSQDAHKYLTENPGISPGAIDWIRKNYKEIRCIGIDCVSISSYKNHELGRKAHLNAFKDVDGLGEPLLLIEDLKLNNIDKDSIKSVIVVPWQIKKIDSAPCTVLAELKN